MDEQNDNENKNQLAEEAKNAVKSEVKSQIMKKVTPWLIKIGIPVILVLLAGALLFGVFNAVGDTVQNIIDSIVEFFTIDPGDGTITISDEQVDTIINSIADMGVSIDGLKLMGDVDYSDPDIQAENQEALREYIRQFYEAQAVTQTLNTNPNWWEEHVLNGGELYGAVYVHRTKGEEVVESTNKNQLTYIPYDEMVAKKEAGDSNITKYFSMDEEGKLVIAGKSETTVTTNGTSSSGSTVTLHHINYKNVISPYTTSMNFFLYLAIITQNPEFASAVADLVKMSEIRITVLDTQTTSVNTETHTYTENTKTRVKVADSSAINEVAGGDTYDESVTSTTKTETKKTTINTTTPTVKVTYVKTWFCEQTITYNKKDFNEPNTNTITLEDEPEPELVGEGVATWKTNQSIKYDSTSSGNTYEEATRGEVIDRTGEKGSQGIKDKNGNGQVDENETVDENTTFVGLLDNKFKIPNTTRYEAPGANLVSGAEMFFYLLQKDAASQNLEQIMRYILYKYTGNDYGVTDLDFSIYDAKDFTTIGGAKISPFETNLSREEFINAVKAYNGGASYINLSNAAGDFYDICEQYNVNPCLAFAWACIETGYGSSIPNNNLFGYAVYNGADSGASYSSYAESIKDFCQWTVDAATSGSSSYNSAYSQAQQFSSVNSSFSGTPDENIYVLFCRYMYLGDTHIADEPDFSNPAGIEYYKSQGSTWGAGGRIHIYTMYETGALYTNEYATRCGHPNGTDLTTLTEKADYAQYSIDSRVKVAENIFGNGCFISSGGSLVEAAYNVADHFMNSGVKVHYAGNDVEGATNNGRHCIYSNIQNSWDLPISNPNQYGVVCATFVSLSIWQTGIIDEATINQYGYNSCEGIEAMLTGSSYASQWQKIMSVSELQEGDIVFYGGDHVLIYVGGGKAIDQNYCVITCNGDDNRGNLVNVTSSFTYAYRYVGN